MGSETGFDVPIIDFTKLDLQSEAINHEEWDCVRRQVEKALSEYGCFKALYKKVSKELQSDMFNVLEELFELPLETKTKCVPTKLIDGYKPLYDFFAVAEATELEKVEAFTKFLWPHGNPSFSETIQSMAKQISELDKITRRMIVESLGVEKYMEEHINSGNDLLGLIKYEESKTTPKMNKGHTDFSILTMVYPNQVEGLELQTRNGDWVSVNSSPDCFLVMAGDSLHAWSNGRIHSPSHIHKVTKKEESNYSISLLSIPKPGYIIEAPKELVDQKHPLLYKPFDHGEFLKFFFTETAQKSESPFKEYCSNV